jgi:hypothetical protein
MKSVNDYMLRRALETLNLMSDGDVEGRIGKLIQRQIAAEAAYTRIAHRSWGRFPQHPAAEGLAALHQYLAGEVVDQRKLVGLGWFGELLAQHRADWEGYEAELGARLRSSSHNFLGCLFELESSHLAREWGHGTRWRWPHNSADADILIDDEIAGECVNALKATEARIPAEAAHDFAQTLSNAMERHGRNLYIRLVVLDKAGPELSVVGHALAAAISHGTTGPVAFACGRIRRQHRGPCTAGCPNFRRSGKRHAQSLRELRVQVGRH